MNRPSLVSDLLGEYESAAGNREGINDILTNGHSDPHTAIELSMEFQEQTLQDSEKTIYVLDSSMRRISTIPPSDQNN